MAKCLSARHLEMRGEVQMGVRVVTFIYTALC